jgi:L-alanine-DL-glutamate epimerase-like enolase superfamily enzyme
MTEPYTLSGGRLFEALDSTLVRIDTDEGVHGWSEAGQWGSTYLPAFSRGVRGGLEELAPAVLGLDPRRLEVVERAMDASLKGHLYVKAAIDYACWDILGKACGLPICELLGGRDPIPAPMISSVMIGEPAAMVEDMRRWSERGFRWHSCKVGVDVDGDIVRVRTLTANRRDGESIVFDANGGWLPYQAVTVMNAVDDLEAWFEQPCLTYEECLAVRRLTRQAMSLDEVIVGVPELARAIADGTCQFVNIKLNRVGGLTRARRLRDLCIAYGIPMLVMDTAGGVVSDTFVAHFAQAIPSRLCVATWPCQDHVTVDAAPGQGARSAGGSLLPPDLPGLGVEPDPDVIGDPVAEYRAA